MSEELIHDSAEPVSFRPYIDPDEVLAAALRLFAVIPDLPKKLLEIAEADERAGKVPSFFDYLFVATSRPADGANYEIPGYRTRQADEWDSVIGASNTNLNELVHFETPQITPEMLAAGMEEYGTRWRGIRDADDEIAKQMLSAAYKAMYLRRP